MQCVIIYGKVSEGELSATCSLYDLFCDVDCIDVTQEGIPTAVNFFEAKVSAEFLSLIYNISLAPRESDYQIYFGILVLTHINYLALDIRKKNHGIPNH